MEGKTIIHKRFQSKELDATRTHNMDKYLKRLIKKVNPMARMLTSTTFRQQTLASKKLYDRKKTKEEDLRDEKDNV